MSRVSPSIRGDNCEILVASRTLSADDHGKTFFLNLAGGFNVNLPAPELGLEFAFIVKLAVTSNLTITSLNAAGSAANLMKGHVLTTDVNSATDADFDTTAVDVITLAANKAVAGDTIKFISDGSFWYYRAEVSVFDAIAGA
jgi:hypothetical protein